MHVDGRAAPAPAAAAAAATAARCGAARSGRGAGAGARAGLQVPDGGGVGEDDVLRVPVGDGRRRESQRADGVHAPLPQKLRQQVAARPRHLPTLPRPHWRRRSGQRSPAPADDSLGS